jgi:hypothetical protein
MLPRRCDEAAGQPRIARSIRHARARRGCVMRVISDDNGFVFYYVFKIPPRPRLAWSKTRSAPRSIRPANRCHRPEPASQLVSPHINYRPQPAFRITNRFVHRFVRSEIFRILVQI